MIMKANMRKSINDFLYRIIGFILYFSHNVELTGFCLRTLAKYKAISIGKQPHLAIAGSGKTPSEAFCYLKFLIFSLNKKTE